MRSETIRFVCVTNRTDVPRQWRAAGPRLPNHHERSAVLSILDAIPMAAVAHTMDHQIIAGNDICATLLGLTAEEMAGRPVRDFVPEPDRLSAQLVARSVIEKAGRSGPVSMLRRLVDGTGRQVTCWLHVGLPEVDGYQCFIACIDLVNPVLSDAHRWRHRAEHDELTGLRRRGSLLAQVGQWIDSNHRLAFAFLDLDNFKAVNDTHGHAAGDHVLSTIARRLEQYAPPGGLVGRLSGDEFVLAHLVRPGTGPDGPAAATADLLRATADRCVAEPIAWGDHLLAVSMSVGIAVSRPGDDASALLARADVEMYAQKATAARARR